MYVNIYTDTYNTRINKCRVAGAPFSWPRSSWTGSRPPSICVYIYVYTYVYTYTCIYR